MTMYVQNYCKTDLLQETILTASNTYYTVISTFQNEDKQVVKIGRPQRQDSGISFPRQKLIHSNVKARERFEYEFKDDLAEK